MTISSMGLHIFINVITPRYIERNVVFIYVSYHDNEWGVLRTDDRYLFEMLILESFQAGLSWECILNKRDAFRKAYDNFSLDKVCSYDEEKINELDDSVRNIAK